MRSAQRIDTDKQRLAESDVEKQAKANLFSWAATCTNTAGSQAASALKSWWKAAHQPSLPCSRAACPPAEPCRASRTVLAPCIPLPALPASCSGLAPVFGQPWPGQLCQSGRMEELRPGCPHKVGHSLVSKGQADIWVWAGVHLWRLSHLSSPRKLSVTISGQETHHALNSTVWILFARSVWCQANTYKIDLPNF